MALHSLRLPRFVAMMAVVGGLALLTACGGGAQVDPVGQNSGSPQNAQGTFNYAAQTDVVKGSVGQSVNVYDSFTSVVTAFTVTSSATTSQSSDQNANTVTLDPGDQFLVLNLTMQNTSEPATGCANPKASQCVETLSPLQNFRLVDSQGRQWPSTTGPILACPDVHDCNNRQWTQEAVAGIAPGATYTNQIAFIIPMSGTFTLYFAPYRFSDATAGVAGGTVSSKSIPTAAAITITI